MYTLHEISTIVNGQLTNNGELGVNSLSFDSRKLLGSTNTLFFALSTDKSDGHSYIKDAISKGVVAVVVERKVAETIPQIIVDDTTQALQMLATHHRNKHNIPVIGITGSNGKTIVKEWLNTVLSEDYRICRNPKSYNSQVGVPLSVWNLSDNHTLGLFEAGISKPNEMENLQRIIQPTIGVFTHMGSAHSSNFRNQRHILEEKIKLFKSSDMVILAQPKGWVVEAFEQNKIPTFICSENNNATVRIVSESGRSITLRYQGEVQIFEKQNNEAANQNLLTTIATSAYLGLSLTQINARVNKLKSIDMRLKQVDGNNGNQIILDYYNSDLRSVEIALDFLQQQKQGEVKTVILSDILQEQLLDKHLYAKVNALLVSKKITNLVGIGPRISEYKDLFTLNAWFYLSTSDFLSNHPLFKHTNESILIKGARDFRFETIASKLKYKSHQTSLEINLSKIQRNLNAIRAGLKSSTKLMAMVKALSYGSGGFQIAKLLEYNNVDFLGVAYLDEALDLRNAGISTPIMVLNPDLSDHSVYSENNIQPVIYSFESLHRIKDSDISFHLEFDTGMHRLGFQKNETQQLVEQLKNINATLVSVMSHLAVADDPNSDTITKDQISQFNQIANTVQDEFNYPIIKHISNTAGIERFKEAEFDMVRLGIGLYGISSIQKNNLEPASTFKAHITQIKEVPAGEGVGYGLHDSSDHNRKIAVVSVGYADGFNRLFSQGKGFFTINGQNAPVVGNVCMDMTMCDVTNIQCEAGDEVVIFGENPTVNELAANIGTIPYEILTNVSERVSRVYFQE